MFKKAITIFFFFSNFLIAVDIGSDTAPNRFNTQQVLNNGDRIAGFAALEGGFALADASTTGFFDSFFGVSGSIELNGGTLGLTKDLIFNDVFSVGSLGNINGNGHLMKIASISMLPTVTGDASNTCFIWSDLNLFLTKNLTLHDCCITFTGESVIDGDGSSLTLQPSCQLLVGENASLRFKDITLKGISGDVFQGIDDTATFTFDNVHLILDGDYTFSQGCFDVINKLAIEGDGNTFNYQTDLVSTITGNASLIFEEGVTFNYNPPTALKDLLVLADDTASIVLCSATLATTSTGIKLTKGTLFIDGKSFLSNTGSVVAEGIVFGDGANFENNLCVEWLPAACLEHAQGFFRDANV